MAQSTNHHDLFCYNDIILIVSWSNNCFLDYDWILIETNDTFWTIIVISAMMNVQYCNLIDISTLIGMIDATQKMYLPPAAVDHHTNYGVSLRMLFATEMADSTFTNGLFLCRICWHTTVYTDGGKLFSLFTKVITCELAAVCCRKIHQHRNENNVTEKYYLYCDEWQH